MLFRNLKSIIFMCLVLLISCDNPEENEHDDHLEAEGFQISQGATAVIDHKDNSVAVTASITMIFSGDEETDEKEYSVKFYDHEGNLFVPGEDHDDHDHEGEGEEETLAIKFFNGSEKVDTSDVLSVELGKHDHAKSSNPENEEWNFHLVPKKAGEAKIVVLIMHGDHADFESQPITVKVN